MSLRCVMQRFLLASVCVLQPHLALLALFFLSNGCSFFLQALRIRSGKRSAGTEASLHAAATDLAASRFRHGPC